MKRNAFILILLITAASWAMAAERITVAQLEQSLQAQRGKSDGSIAHRLAGLELSERVTSAQVSAWKAGLPGDKSRQALIFLSDNSQFLDLPPSEIAPLADPPLTPPPLSDQRQWMNSTLQYVIKTIARLPNFFATRQVTHFDDAPLLTPRPGVRLPQAMRSTGKGIATVVYRNGHEEQDWNAGKDRKRGKASDKLQSKGEFGPILTSVIVDAAHGKVEWSHWEAGPSGHVAVFRFSVPQNHSHYGVSECCEPGGKGAFLKPQTPAYHGTLTIDPSDGSILRITIQAEMKATDPIVRADIMVEYGRIAIGDKSYLCPVWSVSVLKTLVEPFGHITASDTPLGSRSVSDFQAANYLKTAVNDVVFNDYHIFKTEARMITEDSAARENAIQPGPDRTPSPGPSQSQSPKF